MPQRLVCDICQEQTTESSSRWVADTTVCGDCVRAQIVPRFERALEHEEEYPVGWGDKELLVTDFADVLDQGFVERYHRRADEYMIPQARRIVCQHKIRVGNEPPKGGKAPNGVILALPYLKELTLSLSAMVMCGGISEMSPEGSKKCWRCQGLICSRCGTPTTSTGADHPICPERVDKLDIPEGLVRGRDYQTCPNPACGKPWSLSDGCNHMICAHPGCRTPFCFVCGERADEDSGHWNQGKPCPRYNQPGDEGATFDDADDDDDDDDDNDEVIVTVFRSLITRPGEYELLVSVAELYAQLAVILNEQRLPVPMQLEEALPLGIATVRFRGQRQRETFYFMKDFDLQLQDLRFVNGAEDNLVERISAVLRQFFDEAEDIARQAVADILVSCGVNFDFVPLMEDDAMQAAVETPFPAMEDLHDPSAPEGSPRRLFSIHMIRGVEAAELSFQFASFMYLLRDLHYLNEETLPEFFIDILARDMQGIAHVQFYTGAAVAGLNGNQIAVEILVPGQTGPGRPWRIRQLQGYLNRRYEMLAAVTSGILQSWLDLREDQPARELADHAQVQWHDPL